MDFSEIVTAIEEDDQRKLDQILPEAFDVLMGYLVARMGAERTTAKDCVQKTFEQTFTAIQEDKIRDKERLYSYMTTCCRNFYLRGIERNYEAATDLQEITPTHKDLQSTPDQLYNLLDEERKNILEYCIEQLKESYRKLIRYWFENPDSDADDVADHFGISVNNAWTRKHRVVKMLNECYQEQSAK